MDAEGPNRAIVFACPDTERLLLAAEIESRRCGRYIGACLLVKRRVGNGFFVHMRFLKARGPSQMKGPPTGGYVRGR